MLSWRRTELPNSDKLPIGFFVEVCNLTMFMWISVFHIGGISTRLKAGQSFCQILHSYSKQRHYSFSMELLFLFGVFFLLDKKKKCHFSLFCGSRTVLAETSKKIILKQMLYHEKLQVEPHQCDSFKSSDKIEAFLQEKVSNTNCITYTYKTRIHRAC